MAESMKLPVLGPEPARRPAARKPRVPHPHLKTPAPPEPLEDTASWTEAAMPGERRARPSSPISRRRSRASRQRPDERMLRAALRMGLVLNAAALGLPRLMPRLMPVDWRYGASDFLLAGAVLLSGYALLAVGRLRS